MSAGATRERLRTVDEELEELANEALKLVGGKGMTPTEAAIEIVTLEQLSEAALLFTAQRHVGKLTSNMMNRAFRNARTNGDRHERIDRAVEAMEKTLGFALDVLATYRQGADGAERTLREFTIPDHKYRVGIEASIEAGAEARGSWHQSVIRVLQRNHVQTIGELPMSKQYELARDLQKTGDPSVR